MNNETKYLISKKIINLSLIICTLILCTHASNAVLTNQAPAKHQNVNKQTSSTTASAPKKPATPTITAAQKQQYNNDYLIYLEETIKNTRCFTPSDISGADITVNLSFDSNYNVTEAYVAAYSNRASGYDINRDYYNQKCKRCESKLYTIKFKPYDSKYAISGQLPRSFYIKLTDVDTQRKLATKQLISSLKDYWTPPSNDIYDSRRCIGGVCREATTGQYAIVKVILTFGEERFAMKAYSIINSSGDSEYNQMVEVALKRWATKINWNIACDYNHRIGDVATYLKFSGAKISPYQPPESNVTSNESQQTSNTSQQNKSYSNILQYPSFEDYMFRSGNGVLP